MEQDKKKFDDIIIGRNPVLEALKSNRPIINIMIAKGRETSFAHIIALAKKQDIVIKEVDSKKLDYMTGSAVHQGICAVCAVKEYSSVDDILKIAENRGEAPFIIILDEIEDPHNLGAIIRTAECAGAHGVIVKKRHSAGLSFTVNKASAGALEYMAVARVTNISDTIDYLKEKGVWIFGADMDGEDYLKCDFSGSVALVIGNEGKGISRLVRSKCDVIASLPQRGKINSLNASVAAGILMYRVVRFR